MEIHIKRIYLILFSLFISSIIYASEENWNNRVGWYQSNYPDCNINEKADIIVSDMIKEGYKPTVIKDTYIVTIKKIYIDGARIWPPQNYKKDEALKEVEKYIRKSVLRKEY